MRETDSNPVATIRKLRQINALVRLSYGRVCER
jgi:hypothetical protein